MLSLLTFAEIYKSVLISLDPVNQNPECLHVHSFLVALARVGEFAPVHAELRKDGHFYIWSYAERKFVLEQHGSSGYCSQ